VTAVMSFNGSPSIAMMSASKPGAIVPISHLQAVFPRGASKNGYL
jgi:hypothetical protein